MFRSNAADKKTRFQRLSAGKISMLSASANCTLQVLPVPVFPLLLLVPVVLPLVPLGVVPSFLLQPEKIRKRRTKVVHNTDLILICNGRYSKKVILSLINKQHIYPHFGIYRVGKLKGDVSSASLP